MQREAGDLRRQGAILGNLGLDYASRGDLQRAAKYYNNALEICRKTGDREGEATWSWNLGLAFEELDKNDLALSLMKAATDYEQEIDHPDAQKHLSRIESSRKVTAADQVAGEKIEPLR
jgi:tetratricopeptide (TPR) repeat protein